MEHKGTEDKSLDLTEEEFEKLQSMLPGENLSRFLSTLGKGREFIDILNEPVAREFIGRLNAQMIQCENYVLKNIHTEKDGPDMVENKIRLRVYLEEATWIANRVREYYRQSVLLKNMAAR